MIRLAASYAHFVVSSKVLAVSSHYDRDGGVIFIGKARDTHVAPLIL